MSKQKNKSTSPFELEGRPPLYKAIPLALQHILAMFAGNVAVPIIIAGALGMDAAEKTYLIQCAMLVAGIATLIQVIRFGPVGAKLPIVMGTSFGFLSVSIAIGTQFGIAAIFGAALIGGFFEIILGFILKYIRKFFPPIVTGTVLLTIGLSLLPTGINYFAGGVGAADFGAPVNLILGFIVLLVIVILSQYTKGFLRVSAILVGIIIGYLVAIPLGKVSFEAVGNASWFAVPLPLKYGLSFHWPAILSMLIMYIVTSIETVGDISGITVGGLGREATDEELSGGVMADGIGSILASLFNAFPNTSYSQNVGLVAVTRVVSNYVVKIGAVFLVLSALIPKFGAVIAAMPASVLGGATLVMFGSIAVMGIKLISSRPIGSREVTIIAIALSLGFGLSSVPEALVAFGPSLQMILSSGIIVSCLTALILNLAIPERKDENA